jgi:hypothetical protein
MMKAGYLVGCAALPPDINRRFDIGGPDVLTYAEMMRCGYSRAAGLRSRVLIPVPLLRRGCRRCGSGW